MKDIYFIQKVEESILNFTSIIQTLVTLSLAPLKSYQDKPDKLVFKGFLKEPLTSADNIVINATKDGKLLQIGTLKLKAAQTLIELDLTDFFMTEDRLPESLTLTFNNDSAKLWEVDKSYPIFSPRIEVHFNNLKTNSRFQDELKSLIQQLKPKGVVVFPPNIDWNSPLFQRPQQLSIAFAKNNYLTFYCTPSIKYDKYPQGFTKLDEMLYIANVPMASYNAIKKPIVIVNNPINVNNLLLIEEPFLVFDYIDEISIFCLYNQKMETAYNHLTKEADLIIATAENLLSSIQKKRKDAVLCPNGVDFEHFSKAQKALTVPESLQTLLKKNQPIIGYYGAMANWVDYELIKLLAQERKDYQILLIGHNYDGSIDKSGILEFNNIHYLGSKPYQELPQYLSHIDVATIPFLINDITLATNPIKMYEYMAGGKPVVTTGLPECINLKEILSSINYQEFLSNIDLALELINSSQFASESIERAKLNTWDIRAKQLISLFEENLKSR